MIYLDYLQVEIKKNINILRESMTKKLNKNKFIDENNKNIINDNLENIEIIMDDC